MNILGTLAGAALGFATGGPLGAVAGGIQGATATNGTTAQTLTGNVGNAANSAFQSAYLAQSQLDQQQNALFQLKLQEQSSAYDNMMAEKSENMRESNVLRDASMEQRKADMAITKKFIESIG